MDITISIHDHRIRELTIQAPSRTILMRTAFPEMTGPEFAEVVFEGVAGYVFSGDALGTILFDIKPVDALTLYRKHSSAMQSAIAQHGGHRPWAESESSAATFLSKGDVQGYEVSSSIGLEGAIWARGLSVRSERKDARQR